MYTKTGILCIHYYIHNKNMDKRSCKNCASDAAGECWRRLLAGWCYAGWVAGWNGVYIKKMCAPRVLEKVEIELDTINMAAASG